MAALGERIQQLRKTIGLTQNELAKRIDVSHTQMARYEIKGVQPPADVLKKLADVFDTSIDFLVRGDIDDKAAESLEDAELIKQLKQIDSLPKEEKSTVLKFVGAYIRDFKAKQAYAS
ncbi:MAG: helix-turn-helix transcriptional regulator [Flavobacteriales bacterium]|nr:helix-turn-helix transcriptional regulator [Flavobacteriales bacterium]MBL4898914.1 helix-turn-helix transcriptional regulator [Colwellia sp.]